MEVVQDGAGREKGSLSSQLQVWFPGSLAFITEQQKVQGVGGREAGERPGREEEGWMSPLLQTLRARHLLALCLSFLISPHP